MTWDVTHAHRLGVQVPEVPEDCDNSYEEMSAAPPDAVDYQGTTSMQRLNRSLWCEGSGSSTAMSGQFDPSAFHFAKRLPLLCSPSSSNKTIKIFCSLTGSCDLF